MTSRFRIGTFCFELTWPEAITPPMFMKFRAADEEVPSFRYVIETVDELPVPQGELIARRPDLLVYRTPAGESRLLGVKGREEFYACYREVSFPENDPAAAGIPSPDGSSLSGECSVITAGFPPLPGARIALRTSMLAEINIDPVFTSLLALERRQAELGSMILHSAYMVYRDEAILFSAPSGTGKSTQAGLWEKHRGSRVINGDRALLSCADGRWTAGGWPVCGSSGICENQAYPVKAIVMLRQGKENTLHPLAGMEAFRLLLSQITTNSWNRSALADTFDRIEDLIRKVPVYELSCDISEDAVACLERVLYPQGGPDRQNTL